MAEWAAKRFWSTVTVEPVEGGFEVQLDGRALRTPGKLQLVLPQALARAVAEEWSAVDGLIEPETMPLTRAVNSARERVAPQRDAVIAMLAEYGGTDLLSYRAGEPASLVEAQAAAWQPWLDWAAETLEAPLRVTEGVMPVAQDPAALAKLREVLDGLDDLELTGAYDLITLTGSLVLGLAVVRGALDADRAFTLSIVDDEEQARLWGRDEAAEAALNIRRQAVNQAAKLIDLARS